MIYFSEIKNLNPKLILHRPIPTKGARAPPATLLKRVIKNQILSFVFFSSKWSFEYIKRLWLNKSWFMYPKPVKNEDWSDPSLVLERLEFPYYNSNIFLAPIFLYEQVEAVQELVCQKFAQSISVWGENSLSLHNFANVALFWTLSTL